MSSRYAEVTNAIEKMMYKRLSRTGDKAKVKTYLEHLKRNTWKNSPGVCEFIDECIIELENL